MYCQQDLCSVLNLVKMTRCRYEVPNRTAYSDQAEEKLS